MTAIAATATVTAFAPPLPATRAGGTAIDAPVAPAEPVTAAAATAHAAIAPSAAVLARRAAQRYHGRRGLAFVLSGLAGLGVLSLGALTSQVVAAIEVTSLSAADRQVVGVLLRAAPLVMLGGFAQVLSAIAILRDRPRAMRLGIATALVSAAGAAIGILAIRLGAASVVTGAAATPSTDLVNVLAWTFGLDVLAALTIRRIIRGRETA